MHVLVHDAVGEPRQMLVNKVCTETATSRCMFECLTGQLTGGGISRGKAETIEAYCSFVGLSLQHESPHLVHRP